MQSDSIQDQKQTTILINYDYEFSVLKDIAKKKLNKNLAVDNSNRETIKLLIDYMQESENSKLSVLKGVLLIGDVGTGKSMLMSIFAEYGAYNKLKKAFHVQTSRDIERKYKNEGYAGVQYYSNYFGTNRYGSDIVNLCIDDLGIEEGTISNYGDKCDAVSEVLLDRYDKMLNSNVLTFATSNLGDEEFKARYSKRLVSRFNEMFNFVVLKGNDRRKQ